MLREKQAAFGAELIQIATMGIVKTSILHFYRRIFIFREFQIAAMIMICLVASFTLSVFLVRTELDSCLEIISEQKQIVLFSKWPISGQWSPQAPYRLDPAKEVIAFASGNFVLDMITLCMPLLAIRKLQMSLQRKISLVGIFWLGGS